MKALPLALQMEFLIKSYVKFAVGQRTKLISSSFKVSGSVHRIMCDSFIAAPNMMLTYQHETGLLTMN